AAAAAGAHDRLGANWHRNMGAAHELELLLARQPQQIAAGLARRAVPHPPGRTLGAPRLLEIPLALDQVAHAHVEPEPAAQLAGAAGVRPQPAAPHQHRALELDALDRAVAYVALAHRDGGRDAVLERAPAPAAAFQALHDEAPPGLGVLPEEHHGA